MKSWWPVVLVVSVLVSSTLFAQTNSVPQIAQPLLPSSVAPGSPAFTLTVNGSGFVSGAVVKWNGSSRTTGFVNSNRLTATITAADVATAQTGTITVANPGTVAASNIVYLPVVNLVSPVTMIRQDYSNIGNSPACVAVADFNGDGIPDLAYGVFGFSGKSYVSLLLGYGDGTFKTLAPANVGAAPLAIVTGDFNADGKLDLATANSNAGSVSVLLGNGDGTFQPRTDYAVGTFFEQGIAAGDFNHDGNLDLVVSNYSDNNLGVLLGQGDGTFQPVVTYATGTGPYTVVTGDFNHDGELDVAVVNAGTSTVSVLLGKGDGTFQPHTDYLAGSVPLGLVAADFNHDGVLDLITTNDNDATISLLTGNGDGTFASAIRIPVLEGPQSAVAGDFNGDGKLDVAVQTFNCPVSCSEGTLALLLGNGDGTFQSPLDFSTTNLGSYAYAGDFNNDGKLDLAIGAYYSGELATVLLQTPAMSLIPEFLAFANQTVGTRSTQIVTLANNTNSAVTLTSIKEAGAGFFQTNTCGTHLMAGASCTVSVTFNPTTIGLQMATVTILDNGGTGSQIIRASGTGTGPVVTLSKTQLTFPPQKVGSTSAAQGVGVTNNGNAVLRIGKIAASGDFSQTNNCVGGILPGQSCAISVKFTPTATGTRTGHITLTDDAFPRQQEISVVGTGTN